MLGEFPAMFLPAGSMAAKRRRGGGGSDVQTPGRTRQAERLGPAFRRLAAAIEGQRMALGEDPGAAEQEAVLVLEVATSVEEFYTAVAEVDGLRFLLGIGDVEMDQDEDFHLDDRDKTMRGALYMVFSDLSARRELLSLWERWKTDGRLERPYGRFSDVFHHLRTIREWGPQDRIRETGLTDRWREDLQLYGRSPRRAQLELWFHHDATARRQAQAAVTQSVDGLGGRVISAYELEQIRYHGVLVEVPASAAQEVLDAAGEARLLTIGDLMFVRPIPQGFPVDGLGDDAEPEEPAGPRRDEPVIALLDGVPVANHPLLRHHLSIHDVDGLEARTLASRRRHGTAMASLIIHGDLGAPLPPLGRPIAVRPVLEGSAYGDHEHFPNDRLPLDVVHQAVVDLVHGDDAAARSVRIVNVSLGDPAAVFHGPLSPWARLLDYLADRYALLFVVSAGNHDGAITISPDQKDGGIEAEVVAHLRQRSRSRGLLAPAEAINVLTVGAAPDDASVPENDDPRLDLMGAPDLPAAYSALGRGFRRAVKPDVLVEGGRLRYRDVEKDDGDRVFEPVSVNRPPGVRVAAPGIGPTAAGVRYDAGTSHAAALTTGEAGRLWDVLDDLGDPPDWLDERVKPLLVRALLVHAAEWGDGPALLRKWLPDVPHDEVAKLASLMLGYGRVRWDRLRSTHPSRVTLLAGGTVEEDHGVIHTVPLPNALNAVAGRRRVSTTLAWCSPINLQDQRYRRARLWTVADLGPLRLTGEGPDRHEAQRGTIEHRIYTGEDRVTVSDSKVTVHVSCAADAGKLQRFVPYALVVSVEAAPELGLPIHAQVAASVRATALVRSRDRIRQ